MEYNSETAKKETKCSACEKGIGTNPCNCSVCATHIFMRDPISFACSHCGKTSGSNQNCPVCINSANARRALAARVVETGNKWVL